MPAAIITESVFQTNSNQVDQNNFIRQAFVNAGFSATNFSTYGTDADRYWVIEYIWDAQKTKGRTYLRVRAQNQNVGGGTGVHKSISIANFETWNTGNNTGTNGVADLSASSSPFYYSDPNNSTSVNNGANYPLRAYSINHPEMKGVIWQQEDRFRHTFWLKPANIFPDFGYDDVNFSANFITNDLIFAYGNNINPFNSVAPRYNLEQWTQLRYALPDGSRQVVPSPRIGLPNGLNYGVLGWYSEDIALVASDGLPMLSTITDNDRDYLLIDAHTSSGVAIAI